MKANYFLLVLVLFSFKSYSQNFADTKGELQISEMGSATYSIPIAVPPSTGDLAPTVNLVYASGTQGGIVGEGWNISNISSISRISTRIDIDGFKDGVDFDGNDKYALDGQRLVSASGTGTVNSVIFRTELESNVKVLGLSDGSVNLTSFRAIGPDGSISEYQNVSVNYSTSDYYIVRHTDINGNYMTYHYTNISGSTRLSEIKFSGNNNGTLLNSIKFTYKNAKRTAFTFVNGLRYDKVSLLSSVEVFTDGALFRKYVITHVADPVLGYERVSQIQEFNGQNEAANPVLFTYNTTPNTVNFVSGTYLEHINFGEIELSGDFDGDGRADFLTDTQLFSKLFASNQNPLVTNLNFPTVTWIKERKKVFSATTLTGTKINQFQSVVFAHEKASTTDFKVYNLQGPSMVNTYTKTISYDNTVPCLDYCGEGKCENYELLGNSMLEGDFNGDGISEVLIFYEQKKQVWDWITYTVPPTGQPWDPGLFPEMPGGGDYTPGYSYNFCHMELDISRTYKNINIIDLNPTASTTYGTAGFTYLLPTILNNSGVDYNAKKFVVDYNGDGKSDILFINETTKAYVIVGVQQTTRAPFHAFEKLAGGTLPDYNKDNTMLFGDFNGDGKTDLIMPIAVNNSNWVIYFAKPSPSGGAFYTETHNIVEYKPDSLDEDYTKRVFFNNFYTADLNNDGKTDLVKVFRMQYRAGVNNNDTQFSVAAFDNNIGNTSVANKFTQSLDSNILNNDSPELPTPIVAPYRHNQVDSHVIFVRNHNNKLYHYQVNKNVIKDSQLRTVSEASGNILHTIDYLPMEPGVIPSTAFYSSSNAQSYPYVELSKVPSIFLVSKLTATINGVSKFQDFKYRGLVSHLHGMGVVGFTKTSRSGWYTAGATNKIYTTNNNNPLLRGANLVTWTSTDQITLFNTTPSGLLNKKTNTYESISGTGGLLTLRLKTQTFLDYLTLVSNLTTYTYDQFSNPSKTVTQTYLNNVLKGTETTDRLYNNNFNDPDTNYFIGRISSSNTTKTVTIGVSDTRTSSVAYTYTNGASAKGNIKTTETIGHQTNAITEEYTYDTFGNVITKVTSSPGIASRTISSEYDPTGRFVLKETNIHGFAKNHEYNSAGQIKKSTDHLGVITTVTYDNWGKIKESLISNASTTPQKTTYTYIKLSNGGYNVIQHNQAVSNYIATTFDVLGRQVKAMTYGMAANTYITVASEYDVLGRKLKESLPYYEFTGTPKWTTYEYDYLHRPVKITSATGKIQTTTYEGLKVTSSDGTRFKSITKDPFGRDAVVSDNGGSINNTYYATGQLREADYGGHKIIATIDGWGNKKSLTDPSAGTYTYAYDAFGQLTDEITPKGSYKYTFDGFGKLANKMIQGDGVATKTTYTYNQFAELTLEETRKISDNVRTGGRTVHYDQYHRMDFTGRFADKITQYTTLSFDANGRLSSKQTDVSEDWDTGYVAIVTEKYSYNPYNGVMNKITDANGTMLWQLNSVTAAGSSLSETLGNGVTITNSYDDFDYFTAQQHSKNSNNILYNTYSFNAQRGLLNNRSNNVLGITETFSYDNLDRLTQWTNPLTGTTDYNTYDDRGRITENNAIGQINYSEQLLYRKSALNCNPQGYAYYQQKPLQIIKYTMFKAPMAIEEGGKKLDFEYHGGSLNRMQMDYGYQELTPGAGKVFTKRKLYSEDGTNEIVIDKVQKNIKIRTYIGGDAYSAPLYYENTYNWETGVESIKKYYLHRDYLGSILAITDEAGLAKEKRHFDAWGNLSKIVNENNVALNVENGLQFLDRGYTSHEHLDEVKLIHMNGRLYDPKLRSFLQPDNFIQNTEDTQNFNRYSYGLNNPLLYADYSGEELISLGLAIGIGALISVLTYTITAIATDGPITPTGLITAALIGGASAAVTFGIGDAVRTIPNFYVKTMVQAAAHGVSQGTFAGIQGGKFLSAFASGAISSLASSFYSNYGGKFSNSTIGILAFGTVGGGVGAELSGGNFWLGATIGLVVSSLNHVAHKIEVRREAIQRFKKDSSGKNYLLNPKGTPDFSENGIENINSSVDGLQEDYVRSGKPKVTFDLKGKDVGNTDPGHVQLNTPKITNNLEYAVVLFHEYRHAWQWIYKWDKWMKMYENNATIPYRLMERDAYWYQIQIGGGSFYDAYHRFNFYSGLTRSTKLPY